METGPWVAQMGDLAADQEECTIHVRSAFMDRVDRAQPRSSAG